MPTENALISNLVVAPTMRVPRAIVDPSVILLATRAAVRCATDHGFESLTLPGTGTGVGRLALEVAARQMIVGTNEAMSHTPYP